MPQEIQINYWRHMSGFIGQPSYKCGLRDHFMPLTVLCVTLSKVTFPKDWWLLLECMLENFAETIIGMEL